jgi:hypothetical protein
MDLRHNFIAHRGNTTNEINFGYLKMNVETLQRSVHTKQLKRQLPNDGDIIRYNDLLTHLIDLITQKLYKHADKVWKHMMSTFTPEQIAMLKIAGPTKEVLKKS